MTCEELQDDYAAYALGSATDPERSEISAHLARKCPACLTGVRAALATTASMAGAVKVVEPPRGLRKRIVTLVMPDSGRSWISLLIPRAVAAALALALLFTRIPRRTSEDDAKLALALSILNEPATRDVSFGEPSARGRVFVHSVRGVVFIAAHLPVIESGRTFELWVIDQKGNPIPAGTFNSAQDSTAMYVRPGRVDNAAAVAVTVEPSGGSALPTTKPFIVTKL